MTQQVLHCEAGHDWTRPAMRGKRPRFCPDHRPSKEPEPVQRSHSAREPRRHVVDEALDILTSGEWVEHELRAKLTYCVEHVDERNADTPLLVERQHELVREHRRMTRRVPS